MSDIIFSTGMSEKTSLVDADKHMIGDSADSDIAKYVQQETIDTKTLSAINGQSSKAALVAADEFVINDSADSNNPKKTTAANVRAYMRDGLGFYSSEGLYVSGTNLKLNKYVFDVNGILYSGADAVVVDTTGLTASQWYAIVIKESDGVVSTIRAGAAGSWDNWTISGNQLDLLSIYDADYNYCRDSISSAWYRILGVGLVNSTPNDFDYLFNIENRPKSQVSCVCSGTQSVTTATDTVINFDSILFDLLSEITTGAAWKFTASTNKTITYIIKCDMLSATDWTINEISIGKEFISGVQSGYCFYTRMMATANPYTMPNTGGSVAVLKKDDYLDIQYRHNKGTSGTLSSSTLTRYIKITEI